MADLATLQQRLSEAEDAYHRLLTGAAAVQFRDQNGEMIVYQQVNSAKLAQYIASLKAQIDPCNGGSRPLRPWM